MLALLIAVLAATRASKIDNLQVYNGRDVSATEYAQSFPFVVSLQRYSTGSQFHFCTGTFLTKRHILSAAHCANDARPVTVMVGDPNIDAGSRGSATTYNVANIYVHKGYNLVEDANGGVITIAADVAIFELDRDAVQQQHFSQVLGVNFFDSPTLHQAPGTFIGWGITRTGGSVPSNLQIADNTIITREGNPSFCNVYEKGFICASGARYSSGVCSGDSGGPLLTKIDGRYVQVGVASIANCEGGFAAYAYTADFPNWINSVINGTEIPDNDPHDCPGGCISTNPCLINPGTCIDGLCHYYNYHPDGFECAAGKTCQNFQCV